MNLATIMPYIKIGAGLLLAGAAGSAATTAYKSPDKPTVLKCECDCRHPPLKAELMFPKK